MVRSDFLLNLLRGDLNARPSTPEEAHTLNVTRLALAENWPAVLAVSSVLPNHPSLRGLVLAHRAAAMAHGSDLDGALQVLRTLARLRHAGVRNYGLRLLGGTLTLQGRFEEARRYLEDALDTPVAVERYRTHRDLGVLLARTGDYAEAEAYSLRALPGLRGVSKVLALNNLAYLEVRRLAAREALGHLEEALKLPSPKSEQARLWRTRHTAHLLRGEAAQAAYALDRAQALEDSPLVRSLHVHMLRLVGQPSAGLRRLEEAMHGFPGDTLLAFAKAALVSGRDPEQALAILEGLELLDPAEAVRAELFKAHALHTLGHYEESYRCLGLAAQSQGQHPLPFTLEAAHLAALYAWGLLHGLNLPLAWEGIAVSERPRVELVLEGAPRLRLEGCDVGLPPLALNLLGYLWLQGGECPWERLALALWPGTEDPKVLRSRLDNTVSRLRRAVGLALVVCAHGVYHFATELALTVRLEDHRHFLEGCYLDWALEVREQGALIRD